MRLGSIDAAGQAMIPHLVAQGLDPRIITLIVNNGGTDDDLAAILSGDIDALTVFAQMMGWSKAEAQLAFGQATANSPAQAVAITQAAEAAEAALTPQQAVAAATPGASLPIGPPPPVPVSIVSSGGSILSPASPAAPSAPIAVTPIFASPPITSSAIAPAQPGSGSAGAGPLALPVAVVPPSITDEFSGWFGGSTAIAGMQIPNMLLSGGILVVALLVFGGGKRK